MDCLTNFSCDEKEKRRADIFVRVPLRALAKGVCLINYYAFYCDFAGPIFSFQLAPYKLLIKIVTG